MTPIACVIRNTVFLSQFSLGRAALQIFSLDLFPLYMRHITTPLSARGTGCNGHSV